ncbi:MAG: hypothetical protein LQ350_008104 [Teloschistes chrysophthalmus]|nr:MAG: hypothetical protein LQ350_008104 [Niorma chrysophthalma]
MFATILCLTAVFLVWHATATYHHLTIDIVFIHWAPPGLTDPRDPVQAICNGIPPGECCKPHRDEILGPRENLESIEYSATGFATLQQNQIGFGWAAQGNKYEDIKCEGEPILRLPGPNELPYDPWDIGGGGYILTPPGGNFAEEPSTPQSVVFAASWIDLRTRFPASSLETRWLQWQNVRGLVWGANKLNLQQGPLPFPKRDQQTQRLNSWASTGTAYLSAPTRWRRPDLYRINGTNFTDSGDGVYRTEDGRTLNLTNDSPR